MIRSASSFNSALCHDLNYGSFRISKGKYLEIKEAEMFYSSLEPGHVTDDCIAPRQPSWVANSRSVCEFPNNIVVDETLPIQVVIHKCLKMLL